VAQAEPARTIQNCIHDVRTEESEPEFVPDHFRMRLSTRCQFLLTHIFDPKGPSPSIALARWPARHSDLVEPSVPVGSVPLMKVLFWCSSTMATESEQWASRRSKRE